MKKRSPKPSKPAKPAAKAKTKAKATRRSARRPAAGPVSVAAALGTVRQIVLERSGKVYVHNFAGGTQILKTSVAGVLVIRGRFRVDGQGFIRE